MLMRSPNHSKSLNKLSFSPVNSNLLQRKCSCGKCSKCDRENSASQHSKSSQVPPVMHEVLTSPITDIQPKLKIGQLNDKYEREANRVAEQVMRMPEPKIRPQIDIKDRQDNLLQTKPLIQRRVADTNSVSEAPSIVNEVLRSPGQPLDRSTRSFMESRFGHDFSHVRIHTDGKAAQSAQSVNAKAFTVGQNVVFNSGQYAPKTRASKSLIAHELTHVMQQQPQREIADSSDNKSEVENIDDNRLFAKFTSAENLTIQKQPSGRAGTSVYSETADEIHNTQPGVWSGSVLREERTRAGGLISSGRAPVHYDENNCRVTIPMTVAFRHATLSDIRRCPPQLNQPAPSTLPNPVNTSRFRSIADEYVRSMNEDLNGWYSVRLDDCDTNRCHGRDMPIQVQVSEVSAGGSADYEVAIANLSGRSCVDDSNFVRQRSQPAMVLLYARGLDRGTMSHEGGHMVLGHGDEYRESQRPSSSRPEDRVREDDWSLMASHSRFGRFALLHERHFSFVPEFLGRVRPNCNASLVEVQRPAQVDLTLEVGLGYASFASSEGRSNGLYLGLGASLGVPLSRQREWELIIGAHGRFLGELDSPLRKAFLLGARLGLEHTWTPSTGGLTLGGFGEVGASWVNPRTASDSSYTSGSYVEGGAYFGYTSSPGDLSGGSRASLRLEGAVGSTFPSVGTIGEPGAAVPTDPEQLRYFRLGLNAAIRF